MTTRFPRASPRRPVRRDIESSFTSCDKMGFGKGVWEEGLEESWDGENKREGHSKGDEQKELEGSKKKWREFRRWI